MQFDDNVNTARSPPSTSTPTHHIETRRDLGHFLCIDSIARTVQMHNAIGSHNNAAMSASALSGTIRYSRQTSGHCKPVRRSIRIALERTRHSKRQGPPVGRTIALPTRQQGRWTLPTRYDLMVAHRRRQSTHADTDKQVMVTLD